MRLEEKVYSIYRPTGGQSLPNLLSDLFYCQLRSWDLFAENHAALAQVKTRSIVCKSSDQVADLVSVKSSGQCAEQLFPPVARHLSLVTPSEITVQWNPRRLTSTTAKVDQDMGKDKACFLCLENLFPKQLGVLYQEQFLILCNPMPIFDRHFTIAHIQHTPQRLAESVQTLLSLAHDMAGYAVFYNGARCGASAPDHLHFQACPTGALMPSRQIWSLSGKEKIGKSFIACMTGLGRTAAVLSGTDIEDLTRAILKFMETAQSLLPPDQEPMVNAICFFDAAEWQFIIYPRKKHRPDIFYHADPSKRLLISPGAVDMNGIIIVPVEDEFNRIEASDIQRIYEEVSQDEDFVKSVIKAAIIC